NIHVNLCLPFRVAGPKIAVFANTGGNLRFLYEYGSPIQAFNNTFAGQNEAMTISIIITTYNSPDWLEKVLWGYQAQTNHDFEVIIADDGSGEATRQRIEELRPSLKYSVQHIWHEDEGFRKCTIL